MSEHVTDGNSLQGKTILITGAANGIGRAVAKAYAMQGAQCILLDKQIQGLESLYDDIIETGAPLPAIVHFDLLGASPDAYTELANTLGENIKQLDAILHNAATLGTLTPLEHYDIKTWYEVMQVNLHAPLMMTQALLPLLKASQQAKLIFTSSDAGKQAKPYWGAYATASAGIDCISKILAQELENTTIQVTEIDPGTVNTQLRADAYPAEDGSLLPQPDDIVSQYIDIMVNKNSNHDKASKNRRSLHA